MVDGPDGSWAARTETQRGRPWTACGQQRCVDSKNSQTTPASTSSQQTASTSSCFFCELLGTFCNYTHATSIIVGQPHALCKGGHLTPNAYTVRQRISSIATQEARQHKLVYTSPSGAACHLALNASTPLGTS